MRDRLADSKFRALKLLIISGLLIMVTGCSVINKIRTPGQKEEKKNTAVIATESLSRLDSLAGGTAAIDTLVMYRKSPVSDSSSYIKAGKIESTASLRIEQNGLISGYRVQLASSTNKKDLDRLVERVEREFQVKSYIDNHSGRWSLRVGDCQNRQEAEYLRQQAVNFGFKYAWIVQAKVKERF